METLSIAAQVSRQHLLDQRYQIFQQADLEGYHYALLQTAHEILLKVSLRNGRLLIVRLLAIKDALATSSFELLKEHSFQLEVQSGLGQHTIKVQLHAVDTLTIDYTVSYIPALDISGLDFAREILILNEKDLSLPSPGNVYVQQKQLRSGICFTDFGSTATGTLFYFQNLSSLNKYAEHTQQSLSDVVQVQWPELGVSLPLSQEHNLKEGEQYILCEGYLLFQLEQPKSIPLASLQYIRALACIYQRLDRPAIEVLPLPRYANYVLQSLLRQHGCWQQVKEHAYLNAYLNDYPSPPESMVQMAVLVPLLVHKKRHPSRTIEQITKSLLEGIGAFFDDNIGCFVRWIPSKAQHLDHSEEQKNPRIMDSWYLHHPLIQLAFVLEDHTVDAELERHFYSSLRFCMRVAQHFDYTWPVFYNLDTLAVEKEETQPGEGGEKDVAGMYAFLMLRAHALSGKKVYLREAKRAAKSLFQYGFDLLYQSNNTAYAAEALLELWAITQESKYLSYSELCLGNLLRNTGIWKKSYGNAKEYPSFFSLFPLGDAPYSAVFEEQECIACFHRYLRSVYRNKAPVNQELQALLAEYVQYASSRLPYYLPPLLPEDVLATQVKTGYLSPKSWLPVEDLGDGWEAIGQVGQEVYGAGFPFQLIHYHCLPLEDEKCSCYIGYPFVELKRTTKQIRIHILGSPDYPCILQLFGARKHHQYTVQLADGQMQLLNRDDKRFKVKGSQEIIIKWS